MVGHPAIGVVIQLRRLGAGLGEVLDQVEQRARALGEVGDLGGPVVHLRVHVDRVFAAPVGEQVLAPAALQVAGLAACPAAGHRDVAAELEEFRQEVRIGLAFLEGSDSLIGRNAVLPAIPDIQMDPAHQAGEILEMRLLELLEALALDGGENLVASRRGVAADVLVIDIIGRDRQDEGYGIGVLDHQAGIRRRERALLRQGDDIGLEAHSVALDLRDQGEDPGREIAPGAVHGQAVTRGGEFPLEGARQPGLHIHLSGLVGGDFHYHHMVGIGHEHFAGHLDAVLGIMDRDNTRFHVEFTVVIRDRPCSGLEIQKQVAHRDIGLLVGRFPVEMFVHEFLRFLVLLRVHQFLDLVVVLMGVRVVVVVRTAGPEGGFVERDALVLHASEHVAAHVAVADEQAVQPHLAGRLVIPQDHLPAGVGSGLGAGH